METMKPLSLPRTKFTYTAESDSRRNATWDTTTTKTKSNGKQQVKLVKIRDSLLILLEVTRATRS